MALNRLDPGQFKQDVTVNGLPFGNFKHYWKDLKVGDTLLLYREKSNIHDARAVSVRAKDMSHLGWIPKAVNHDIAALMDQGRVLHAQIIRIDQADLGIRVTAQRPEPPPKATYPRPKLHLGDSIRDGLALKVADGTVMRLRTNGNRSTITVVDPDQQLDLYYFHKCELPASVESQLLSGRLHLVKRGNRYEVEDPTATIEPSTSPTGRVIVDHTPTYQNFPTTTEKGNTMSLSSKTTDFVNNNKTAAQQAAYLEAGRIANNQVVKLSSKALPMMLRGYADTPIGKLLAANIAQMAAAQLRPNDPTLAKLTGAMTVSAYQAVIQTVDIEGWLDELMGSPEIQKAVNKLNAADDRTGRSSPAHD